MFISLEKLPPVVGWRLRSHRKSLGRYFRPAGVLPDARIISAMKSGTTTRFDDRRRFRKVLSLTTETLWRLALDLVRRRSAQSGQHDAPILQWLENDSGKRPMLLDSERWTCDTEPAVSARSKFAALPGCALGCLRGNAGGHAEAMPIEDWGWLR